MALQSTQRLPVASFHSFYTKKSKGFFQHSFYIQKAKSSSSNSTCRRQGDLLSSLQRPTRHSRHSSRKTFHRHSSSTRTFQSLMTFQTFQSFMAFQPSRHYYTFQHLPSTTQYLPVLSSVSRDSIHSSISSIRMQILHTDWFTPETPSSTSWYILQTLHSSKKGRCCDIGQTLTFYRIELRVKLTFSQSRINSPFRVV